MNELINLENRVTELENWKNSRLKERFKFPLDIDTTNTLRRANIIATGNTFVTNGVQLTDFIGFGLICNIMGVNKGPQYKVFVATSPLVQFQANAGTDFLTSFSGTSELRNGSMLIMTTSGTMPSPLTQTDVYYVINKSGTSFQVSLSEGGSAEDITTTGSGSHYYVKI